MFALPMLSIVCLKMFSSDVLNVVAVGNTMKNKRHSSFNAKTTFVRNVKKEQRRN